MLCLGSLMGRKDNSVDGIYTEKHRMKINMRRDVEKGRQWGRNTGRKTFCFTRMVKSSSLAVVIDCGNIEETWDKIQGLFIEN